MENYHFFIVIIALCSNFGQANSESAEIIKVITKFFAVQKQPTKVISFLCWKDENIVSLTKSITREDIMISTNFDFTIQSKLLPTFHPGEHQFYLLDGDCTFGENILQTAHRTRLLEPPYRWLILDGFNKNRTNLDVYLNTRIYILRKWDYKVVSVYKHAINNSLMYEDITSWNGEDILYYNEISDVKNRSDLVGAPMNISMVLLYKESLKHLTDLRDKEHDAVSKHNYALVRHVVEAINVTANFLIRDTWGYLNQKTGLYDGMHGDIQSKIAEIGATASLYTTHRTTFVDWISETTPTHGKFIFRSPPLSAVSNVFYLPFSQFVWLACIGLLVVIFWVVYVIIKWEWSNELFQESIGPTKTAVLRPGWMDVVQMEIGAVCQQGAEAEPKSGGGRIATFFIFLMLMFLYVSYSANIVALLQSTTDNIKSLDDLYESKMEMAVENVSYMKYFFKLTKGETQRMVRENRISPPNKPENYIPALVGVEKVRTSFCAFFAEVDTIYKIVSKTFREHEKCGLNEVSYWSLKNPVVLTRKNSTYKELIKIAYVKIYERGIRMRSYRLHYATKPSCQNQGANFTSVSINDCYFAAMAFGIGLGVSLLVFILELGAKRARKIHNTTLNAVK